MGQERLPVDGELGSARRAAEQPHTKVFLQCGDALGDGLLGDRQVIGGIGELACLRDDDEGTHRIEVHAHRPYGYNARLWLAGRVVVCSARLLLALIGA